MSWVNPGTPEWTQVVSLAEKYGQIRMEPVIAIWEDTRILAFVQPIKTPVLNSVWDEQMSARQFAEGVNLIKNFANLAYGECLLTCHETSPVFPHAKALGFRNSEQLIFTAE